jgi:hypothetical protein
MFDKRRDRKLEDRRWTTLSDIRWQQLAVYTMVQRARIAGEASDDAFLNGITERLDAIVRRANDESNIDELKELVEDAEQQGQLRAYICPIVEVPDEGVNGGENPRINGASSFHL